jgi:hypothetical protein
MLELEKSFEPVRVHRKSDTEHYPVIELAKGADLITPEAIETKIALYCAAYSMLATGQFIDSLVVAVPGNNE